MEDGNIREAGKLVTQKASDSKKLLADDLVETDGTYLTVRQIMQQLRTPPTVPRQEAIIECDKENLQPMPKREVTAAMIADRLRGMEGSAGPSGSNVQFWKDACRYNGKQSERLREAIAAFSTTLHNEYVSPGIIEALGDSRAVTIDRGPDKKTRPLQIAEVLTRIIIGEAVHYHKTEVVRAVGADQIGVGMKAGLEALVHAMDEGLEKQGATLSVDIVNAYGTCCKYTGMINARIELPQMARLLFNFGRVNETVMSLGRNQMYYDAGGGSLSCDHPAATLLDMR